MFWIRISNAAAHRRDDSMHMSISWSKQYGRVSVTGRFAPSSVRPLDVSPSRRFAPWTYSAFPSHFVHFIFYYFKAASDNLLKQMMMKILLIQLKPKHRGRNVLGAKRPVGKLTKERNVHKPACQIKLAMLLNYLAYFMQSQFKLRKLSTGMGLSEVTTYTTDHN